MTLARAFAAVLLLAFLSACAAVPSGPSAPPDPWVAEVRRPGVVAPIAAPMREEAWLVPSGAALLKARVFRPQGNGPFPVAVIAHGSPGEPGRQTMGVPEYRAASQWFVARGYMVVLPLRRGFGDGGPWPERVGACTAPDYVGSGRAMAEDIDAVVRYVRQLPMAKPDRVLLVGDAAGGLGVIAAASRNPPGVFATINIAGGRAGDDGAKCLPQKLVEANEVFGRTAKVPTLWLYSENDRLIDQDMSNALVSAYGEAGGRAVYVLVSPFREDGSAVFSDDGGVPYWSPYVRSFLDALE